MNNVINIEEYCHRCRKKKPASHDWEINGFEWNSEVPVCSSCMIKGIQETLDEAVSGS